MSFEETSPEDLVSIMLGSFARCEHIILPPARAGSRLREESLRFRAPVVATDSC